MNKSNIQYGIPQHSMKEGRPWNFLVLPCSTGRISSCQHSEGSVVFLGWQFRDMALAYTAVLASKSERELKQN